MRVNGSDRLGAPVNADATQASSSGSLTGCRVNRMIYTPVPPPCASALLGGTSR
jgi:hypothetical protein